MTDAELVSALAVFILVGSFIAALVTSRPIGNPPDPVPLNFTGVERRRRDAKRFNEHAKLFATFLNNLGVASIVTLALAPVVQGRGPIEWPRTFLALSVAGMLHMFAQLALRLWKSEE